MLAGLAFSDARETRRAVRREKKRRKKSSESRRRDDEDDDRGESEESEDEGKDAPATTTTTTTTAAAIEREDTEDEPSAQHADFFSAALASKSTDRREDGRGAAAERKRREDEARVAKIVASRELNPEMRGGDGGGATNAVASTSAHVVGDGGASWRLKALRRAQERAVAEGRRVDEVVSEHWGSVGELVAGIGDGAAHSKAHLRARRGGRHGGGGGADSRMQKPDDGFGRRRRERLDDEDKKLIDGALMMGANKFASDGSFMSQFEARAEPVEDVSLTSAQPSDVARERDAPPTSRAVPEGRNLAAGGSTNMSAAAALKARLFGGNKAPATAAGPTEALPMVTADGRAAPGAFGRNTTVKGGVNAAHGDVRKAPKTTQRFDNGERSRYYADDNGKSLQDLVAEQKYSGTEDYDGNLADNIARHKRYRGKELDVDDEYDHDGGLEMYENREKKMSGAKQQARAKEKAVRDFKRMQAQQNKCPYCMDAPDKPKHLHVAYGNSAYLMLPPTGRLVPGHCIIAPIAHTQSSRQVDEDVWEEMRNFKKCLVRMFAQQGKDCCFIETAMKFGHGGRHGIVECIPIPQEIAVNAPMYFKKAIDEAESEWSTHDAKKCLSTAPPKGLRGTIPEKFPYFHVEFNMRGGFVHVIDDETKWKSNFGRNILIGLLDLPEHLTDARQRALAPALLREEMDAFLKLYDPVDWTKQLE